VAGYGVEAILMFYSGLLHGWILPRRGYSCAHPQRLSQ